MTRAGSAAADARPPSTSCTAAGGLINVCPPPPLLGNLDSGLTSATPQQRQSLRKFEDEAVQEVIALHDLSASDTNAVLTWGRSEALAALYGKLLGAIKAPAPRDTDDQNVVDWFTTMVQRKKVSAAVAAGREYVRWAGLNEGQFEQLVNANASESELTEFLNDPPQNYNDPNIAAATSGYCKYRSPAPYGSEYTGYNNPTCFAPCASMLGCNPPTPSFDQFVKWGETLASYSVLNTEQYARTALKVGAAIGVSAAVAAGVAGGTAAAVALAGTVGPLAVPLAVAVESALATAAYLGLPLWTPTMISPWGLTVFSTASSIAGVAAIIIVAIVIAVMQGIAVVDAAELPGQLAELIVDDRTNTPDVDALIDTTDGATTLFSLFVAAALPEPRDEYCDNSSTVPDNIVHGGFFVNLSFRPCLNATPIPAATPFDPQFLIKEDGATTGTMSPTITWRDETENTTTTARLHENWFITEPIGSYDEQKLSITYTDWDGEQQQAILLGSPDNGYAFVSIGASDGDTAVDLSDCIDDGLCSASESLQYMSPDGRKLSASVRAWDPGLGAPDYDSTPDEGVPVSYDANGFAPTDATGEVTYQWRFQDDYCRRAVPWLCVGASLQDPRLVGGSSGPAYGAAVAGETASHTWGHPGPFSVELTATDGEGKAATKTFQVDVQNTPPTIVSFVPDCRKTAAGDLVLGPGCLARTGSPVTARQLRGTFDDAGHLDLKAVINWGDGSTPVWKCVTTATGILAEPRTGWPNCSDGDQFDNGLWLTRTEVDGNPAYQFDASHVYAEPGVYHGTMWVSDGVDASAEPFTMTIVDPTDVLVSTNTADGVVRLAEQDATSHTIDVRLASRPIGDITVAVVADKRQAQVVDGVSVNGPSYRLLTFTPDNWDQPQSVTVRAIDDSFHEDDPHSSAVQVGVVRGDGRLSIDGQVGSHVVPLEIADNDQAGLVLSSSSLALTEGGPAATVSVGISSTPKDASVVDVTATTSGLCTVDPASLTDVQYNAPRTLTVTPGRDHVPGDRDCTVHLVTTSQRVLSILGNTLRMPGDPEYAGLSAEVAGPVTNVDIPGVTVIPTELVLDTTAANPTATYQLVLDSKPTDPVTITSTTGDPALSVSGPVAFTPDNWDQPQAVTVTAPAGTAAHTAVINLQITGGDADYLGLDPGDVTVAVGDPTTAVTLSAIPDQPTTTKPITVTATLSAAVGTPAGTTLFAVDGVACDSGNPVCDIDLVQGAADYDLGRLPAGSHTVTASYPGDVTHLPATATIEFDVIGVSPEPVDDTVTVAEDAGLSRVDVLANDADADALWITDHTAAVHGAVSCELDGCNYTPDHDFHGVDGFTYTVTEGTHTATATVTITVDPVNDPPAAIDDPATTDEDTATRIEVVANDRDVDGDPLTVTDHTQPTNGDVACDETSCRYIPGRDFHGIDTFTYTVSDGDKTASAAVTVTVDPVNDAPVAAADTATTAEDTAARIGLAGNDSDVDGDPLTVAGHTQPTNGEVTCDETSCTYTPHRDFHGTDSFTYVVSDGDKTASATVTVTVESVNDAPVAVDDAATTDEDAAARIGVVGNDSDVERDSLTIEKHTQPAHGDVACDDASCTYTPRPNFYGGDEFTYTVSDGDKSATATVTVEVHPVQDPPVAADDSVTVAEDGDAARIDVVGNDSDLDGDPLTVAHNTAAANGVVTCNETSCSYTPHHDFHGVDTFTYIVSDGVDTATGTVTVTVDSVNDPPVAVDDAARTDEDTAAIIELVGNDSDVDGDSLTVVDHAKATDGDVSCDDTSCTYTPHRDFHGVDTFTYTVSDGVDTATGTVTVTVESVNDAPVAVDDATTVAEDANATRIEVIGNDSDVEGDSLTVADHTDPANGLVDCDDTSCTYTPHRDFHGVDTFTYTLSDGVDTATATVTVTVESVNDPPVAVDDTYTSIEDTALDVAAGDGLLANDSDVDGDSLSTVVKAEPAHGTVTVHDNGSFSYLPEAGYRGPDSFTYRARDVDGAMSPVATVSVTVATATATTLAATPSPSRPGQPVTFTATVTAHGEAMTAGTVRFRDGATMLKANLAVDDQGQATFATARLAGGTHHVTAAYQPVEGFAPSTSQPLIHVVDGAGPHANPTPSPAANAAGWHRAPVTVAWNWNDHGAGIDPAHCPDRSSTDREGRQTLTATCRDLAGNETTVTHSVNVDTTSPTVSIALPTDGRYLQGDLVTADYSCQDGLSGVVECTGPVADGAGLDTSTPGHQQFVVTARDHADNEYSLTVSYDVAVRPTCAGRPATIVGTAGNDVIYGTVGDDVIVTGAGRDWIRARAGNDVICAGVAPDVVSGGDGEDIVDTGTGRDIGAGGLGDDTIAGRDNADILTGGLGADTLTGGLGADTLIGHDGDDHLHGGAGADTCRGGTGTDQQTACEFILSVP